VLVTISATLVSRPVTLDQLAALSNEIAALARAGVPLDRGLQDLAHDLPGKLGQLANQMGQRLEAGQPLEQVVAELSASLPPAYRAVLIAGQRGGRLSAALEGVAHSARRISQLRRTIGLSLLYPLIVLLVAWGLFWFVVGKLTPVMLVAMSDAGLPTETFAAITGWLSRTAPLWQLLAPLFAGAWLAWVWIQSGRVARGVELHPLLGFGAAGTLVRMRRAGRISSLADLLALLVSHEVPLPEAIELASAAVGSSQIERGGKELAERLRRGEKIDRVPKGFPPLIAWTLTGGSDPRRLPQVLLRTAQTYRDEFNRRGQWLQLYVPLATAAACGMIVILYALLTLLPWIAILHQLSRPV
jgi:type II secretory pathway component PulF